MNAEQLLIDAQRNLDNNLFGKARELYRQAALISEPSHVHLGNLCVAEDEERVQFRRDLCSCHPSSLTCIMSQIQALETAGHSGLAVQLASNTLEASKLSQSVILLLRITRLKCALTAMNCNLVIEDFSYVWKAGENNEKAKLFRNGIIKYLMSCGNPSFADVYRDMSMLQFVDELVSELLMAKSAELRLMQAVLGKCM